MMLVKKVENNNRFQEVYHETISLTPSIGVTESKQEHYTCGCEISHSNIELRC
jgi:hypothetical protein